MSSESIKGIQSLTEVVDGWLGKREGPYLYSLAKAASRRGVVVEIGSWKGKSTIWLAKASETVGGAQVYAIDPHVGGPDQEKIGYHAVSTENEFRCNIKAAGVESLVVPLVRSSMDAAKGWDKAIGLLWIDGDHSYESVRGDFFTWEPHVVEGGIIALHDTYSWGGVRRVVDEEILRLNSFQVLGQVDGILAVKKVRSLDSSMRVKRVLVSSLRRVYNEARVQRKHWRALPRKMLRGLSVPKIEI